MSQFPECGLAVAVATDSTLYQSQVFTASHGDSSSNTNYRSPQRHYMRTWGERPVLLLLGIRLGIEGVNPIYYDTIKVCSVFFKILFDRLAIRRDFTSSRNLLALQVADRAHLTIS